MSRSTHVGGRYGRRTAWVLTALVAGFALAALAAMAGAKTTKPKPATLQTAHNSVVGATIIVDNKGMTLYELKGETTHPNHLLCTSNTCFGFWPPYKVSKTAKLTKAAGIKGKLALLHRDGFYQVTLDGHPLYHFAADKKKGQAFGQGIKSFGGTWGTVKVSTHKSQGTTTSSSASTTTSTATTTTSTYTYPYPYP
jgi:predicted lipoprotein with Yx(FWY)xxD motif